MTSLLTFPRLCGSVAANPSKLGVALHNAGYRELGLDYAYIATGAEDIDSAVRGFRTLGFRGFGVSMPFKADVIRCLDEVSEDVQIIGACNTVVNDDGKLKGYNTDWKGAITALEECGATRPSRAVIIGAGGVARAIAFGLKRNKWEVWIAARREDRANGLVKDLGLDGALALEFQGRASAQLIVNATPIADAHGGPTVIEDHPEARYLLDVVFSPKETGLAAVARQSGVSVAPGWKMLLYQALHQFELYTGQPAPKEIMAKVLEDALG